MIYAKVRNGLANRMRVIASVLDIAKKTNQKVTVFWPVTQDCNCRFDDLFKDIPGCKVINCYFKYDLRIIVSMIISSRSYIHITQGEEERLKMLYNDCISNKSVFIHTCEQFGNLDWMKLLIPTDNIAVQATERLKAAGDNICGIHIRRTDNTVSIEYSPTELFVEKIEKEIMDSPLTKFYLATDSPEVGSYITTCFQDKVIWERDSELSRNKSEGIKAALVDMLCLSKCKKIIGSYYSSFSEMAAIWGGVPLQQIVKDKDEE